MKYLIFFIFPLLVPVFPSFAESHPEYFGMSNPSEFILKIDDHTFSVPYEVNADVIAMAIDPELTSLLIALENTDDSVFKIDLQHELINAQNNEFAILVNGFEVDYEIISDSDSSTFSFFVPQYTEEIEIIGTHVIPEFPLGAIMGLTLSVIAVTLFSRTKISFFKS